MGSLLPQIANWFSPAVRGLLALAPRPAAPSPSYPAPGMPCAGVPGGPGNTTTTPVLSDTLNCGRCVQLYYHDYSPLLDYWQQNHPYNAGNLVAPKTYNGFAFRAQNNGTSGSYGIDPADGVSPLDPPWPAKLSATFSDNSPGCNTPGHTDCLVWKAEPEPLCGFVDLDGDGNPDLVTPDVRNPLPLFDRGFDDPQADPDLTFLYSGNTCGPRKDQECRAFITYQRADIWNFPQPAACLGDPAATPPVPANPDACIFPYRQQVSDARNGNPPWGSQPPVVPGDPDTADSNPPNDMDADGTTDPVSLTDRHNRGEYAAFFNLDRYQLAQQSPNDAFAEPSHPAKATCDVYSEDCGGLALFNCGGRSPCVKPSDSLGAAYRPYVAGTEPPAPETWPLVPFPRDWGPYKSTDADPVPAIKRLLRFTSSIVSFNSAATHMNEYSLAEDAVNVVVMAPGTPIAGSLLDAYNYFKNSVIAQSDPFSDCRKMKIVLITDGLESSGADACAGGPSGNGPAGDLKSISVPVIVVGLGVLNSNPTDCLPPHTPPCFSPKLQCIADNSGGAIYEADNRDSLVAALQGAIASTGTVGLNNFSSPALPALSLSSGDQAIIGAVIPSHKNPTPVGDGSNASWAIWNGTLKAYRLDSNGDIPLVPAAITDTPVAGTATPTPVVATVTPLPVGFADERSPNDADLNTRRPIWSAGRVIGYTDPTTNLAGGGASVASFAPANDLPVNVWPGRRMVWADDPGTGAAAVPLTRKDFMPNTLPSGSASSCTGIAAPTDCFYRLMLAMGLKPAVAGDVTTANRTVQFMRGGKTQPTAACTTTTGPCPGSRDEILTDLGSYGTVKASTIYSYFYQDDIPAGNPSTAQTDGATTPPGYAHKLGDIFHSEAALLLPPKYFQYLSSNLTPDGAPGTCGLGTSGDCSYGAFASYHAKRRKVVFVGANDGFLHAFDAGVFDRDDDPGQVGPTAAHPFNDTFDLGTGREIFAFAPRSVMPLQTDPTLAGFPALLSYPPKVQYFVDGSPVPADVFIGPTDAAGTPLPDGRTWRTILVSGLRQGGRSYFALDVTQPDVYAADGTKSTAKDSTPDCLGTNAYPSAPAAGCSPLYSPGLYPMALWEMTDNATPPMGETWSRPVVGRIHVGSGAGFTDRYVAIFGGGYDSTFVPVSDPATGFYRGRSLYIVNVENGKILYKASSGTSDAGPVLFAPMPAPPAVVDVDDDGYLDVAYIGDLNGRMWRLDLRTSTCSSCGAANETLTGLSPFLLYDAMTGASPYQPIFFDPGIIFISGGLTPIVGVGFGTGYRAELLRANPNVNRFFYVIDPGTGDKTFHEADLANITPEGGITPAGDGPPAGNAAHACTPSDAGPCGYFLDFAGRRPPADSEHGPTFSMDEKAISTVFSTLGNLSLVTFIPDDTTVLCGNGTSYRYSFLYTSGQGSYNLTPLGSHGQLTDYQQVLGAGLASVGQSQSPSGDMIDTVIFSSGAIYQKNTSATLKTLNQNWKEQ